MRYMIVSDIHSNLEAQTVFLESILPGSKCDALICLGDLVGYGPDPEECVARLRAANARMIRGNHDRAVASGDYRGFSEEASVSDQWTRRVISPEARSFLASLPIGPAVVDASFAVCHGSPLDEDIYVASPARAREAFAWLKKAETRLLFCGHTHIPRMFVMEITRKKIGEFRLRNTTLDESSLYIINPGSLGQSRDGSTMASCAVYNDEAHAIESIRFPYMVSATIRKTFARRLSCDEMLASYLRKGR